MNYVLILLSILIVSASSHAALVGVWNPSQPVKQQHIIFAGVGNDLGDMFLQTALGKAHVLKQNDPSARVILVSNVNKDLEKEALLIERAGFQVLEKTNRPAGLEKLTDSFLGSLKIASVSIYSHAAITYGVHLFKGGRYSSQNPAWKQLKGKFTDSGYIFLYGCNTGFELAPALSKILNVPVAGTLTSLEFQYLDRDHLWKYSQPITDIWYPQVSENRKGLSNPVSCSLGACIRMMPLFRGYSGYWGAYKSSLPVFKFFCAGSDTKTCKKTMATSFFHQLIDRPLSVNSSLQELTSAVAQFFCPRFSNVENSANCESSLLQENLQDKASTFSPARGPTLSCTFERCDFQLECKRKSLTNSDKACTMVQPETRSTSFVDEFKAYLEGFVALKKSDSN